MDSVNVTYSFSSHISYVFRSTYILSILLSSIRAKFKNMLAASIFEELPDHVLRNFLHLTLISKSKLITDFSF